MQERLALNNLIFTTMEKESLIEGLRSRLGDNASAVSDRSYDEIATVALPMFADDANVTDDTWKMPVQMLNSLVGQYRHDVADGIAKGKETWTTEQAEVQKNAIAEAVKNAKAEWEAAQKKNNSEPAKGNGNSGKTNDDILEQVKNLLAENNKQLLADDGAIGKLSKSMNGFVETYNKQQREAWEKGIRTQIAEYLKGKNATYEAALSHTVRNLQIGDNPDIDVLKMQAEKDYMSMVKDFYGDGGKPFGGNGSGGTGKSLVDDYIKQRAEEAKKEANDAEALRKSFK
nr:MAG TPA: hypothetical protein [Caudoviricetes sp.]